jgi:hypothetical protein
MRSVIAVGAGFLVFSVLFTLLGPGLGAILTAIAAGLMAGYISGKIAQSRELTHGGVTAGLTAAALLGAPQVTMTIGARVMVAVIAAAAITAGSWVRGQARAAGQDVRQQGEHS